MTFVLFQMNCVCPVFIELELMSQMNEEVNLSSHLNPNLQSLEQSKNTQLFRSISP